MRRASFPVVATLLALVVPFRAAAIPPPDILISIGSSFGQIFSLVIVLLSGLFAAAAQTVQAYRPRLRVRPAIYVTAIVGLIFVSAAIATVADQTRQRAEIARIVERNVSEASSRSVALPVAESSYFHDNATLPLDISNGDFAAIESIPSSDGTPPTAAANPYVLDAREDEEVEIGRYPGSVHVRLADLLDGAYAGVPRDRTVYVFCWSGIRGSEVATFLRDHGVLARYLSDGAEGWVSSGGRWDGGVKFSSVYSAPQYARTLTADETDATVADGAVLVDARDAERTARKPIAGSIPISAIFTPTSALETAFALVPAGVDVIAVCDDFVSCFDAKLVGIRLEKRGHAFVGRYVY